MDYTLYESAIENIESALENIDELLKYLNVDTVSTTNDKTENIHTIVNDFKSQIEADKDALPGKISEMKAIAKYVTGG